ncbi:uncharacterized protein ARMOST_17511 [Armillaria ostoyae]|uniref:Uncharacterized protein n=1 Tax=Armillaria ostoyae TaxID=47428 RepID=A0A284RZ77_ARMOS|nr:uncharacterized protein ARMOST_17511 [Armillaria ostoyae]
MFMAGLSSVRRSVTSVFNNVAKSFGANTSDESGKAHPGPRSRSSREPMPGSIVQESETRDIHHRLPAKGDTETKLESQTPPSTNTYQNVQSRTQPLKIPVKESEPKAAERNLRYSDAAKMPAKDKKVEERNVRINREQKPQSEHPQTLNKASAEDNQLSSRIAEAEKKSALVKDELVQATERNEAARKKVLELQQEIARLQQQGADEKRSLETQLQSVMKQSDIRKLEIERVNQELEKERTFRKAEHALLDLRMRELQDARAYLTTEDAISGEEIKGMTEALNTEVYQVAAFMADTLDFDGASPADEMNKAAAARWIGEPLVGVLSSGAPKNDSEEETRHLATLAVIQTSIVQTCISLINTWSFHPNVNDHFAGLYANIRETSTSAVAGRWRAMTRARCKYQGPEKEIEGHLVHCLLRDLAPVLAIAGWKIPPSVKAESAISALSQIFRTRLGQITRKMVRLDKAMGEGVISKDAQLCWVTAGTPFEPSLMENAYGKSPDISARDVVLSTCDLGLMLSQISNDSNGAESGRGEEVQAQVLLKVKVVLHSALFEHK